MNERLLSVCRVLVVEDEYLIADELKTELENLGAIVIGPVGTLQEAMALIESRPVVDVALLDVNLRGEMVYPAATLLMERQVPVIFTTGYDASVIPSCFGGVVRCTKPVNIHELTAAITRVVSRPGAEVPASP